MKRVCRKALAYLLAAIMVVGCYVPTYAAELRHESVSAGDVSSSDSADPSDEGIKDVSGGDTESPDGDTDSDGDIKPSVSDGDSNGTVSGGDALKKYYAKLLEPMNELLSEKTVQAVAYMADYINVWSAADWESDVITSVPSGHTVIIKKVETDGTFLWCYVSFAYDEVEYEGYIPRPYLACSDELFLEQEEVLTQAGIGNISTYATGYGDIDQFPESYQAALLALKKAHPNWVFVKQNTGLNWNDVIANEQGDKSLVPSNSPAAWKVRDYDKSWSVASEGIVKYYIDPRNALTENGIFQFEQLTYNASYHTLSAVQKCLDNTFMSGKMPGYDITYAQAFTQIGSNLHVSPFHLACRVYQEQGQGTSPLISGNYPGYIGYYNYFNIGASGNTNQMVITNGLARAKREGWNSRDKSIAGGAKIIAENYILKGQDTLYLQKFDVDASYNGLFSHQYMQNIIAPTSESSNVRKAYVNSGSLENSFVFKIPVYNNMPASACSIPTGVENATMSVSKDSWNTQIYIRVNNISSNTTGVKAAVWSEVNGQDDLIWYNLNSQGNNAWAMDVSIGNHKLSTGNYFVHLFADVNGKSQLISGTAIKIDGISGGNLKISNQYEQEGLFTASISGLIAPMDITGVRYAVWSELNGQDDLKWYSATLVGGVWQAEIDTANHKYDEGNYFVHAYALDKRGVYECVKSGSVVVKQTGNIMYSIEKSTEEDGFIINMFNAKLNRQFTGLSVAVWSNNGGQDDLKWYKATAIGKNSYQVKVKIRDHKNDTGGYNAHIYYQNSVGQNVKLVNAFNVDITGISAGKFYTEGVNHAAGTFRARVIDANSPAGIETVKFAVWSEVNGQDDLKWHVAQKKDNYWYADIDTEEHGYDDGAYQVHAYVVDGRGISKIVGSERITINQSANKVTYTFDRSATQDGFYVTLYNVKLGRKYSSISIPAWSTVNGQDDLIWYEAKKLARNTYQAYIRIKDHNYDTGNYDAHIYYKNSNGTLGQIIGSGSVFIGNLSTGSISITSKDDAQGIFVAKIKGVSSPAGISNVKVAVWSEINGQDDIIWYNGTKSGEDWDITINTANHGYDGGKYQLHAYATDARGITKCIASTVTEVTQSYTGVSFQLIANSDNSGFKVVLSNVKIGRDYSGVSVPVWSSINGQDDLVWYSAVKTGTNTYEVQVPISNHKNNRGTYCADAYLVKKSGGVGEIIGSNTIYLPTN